MPARRTPHARHLMALLVLTLALAGLVALEAEDDVGEHRAAAQRAVGEYVAAAGRDAVDAVASTASTAVAAALEPVTGGRASSPYELLPAPSVLAATTATTLPCPTDAPDAPDAPDVARVYFRVDFRDRTLAVSGGAPGPALLRWLRDTIPAAVRGGGRAPLGVAFGRGATEGRVAVYGVKFAQYDAPLAAYGFVTCAAAFGRPLFAAAAAGRGGDALAPVLADSLVALELLDGPSRTREGAGVRVLLRTAPENVWVPDGGDARGPHGPVAEATLGGLTVRAWAGPGAARRLVVRGGGRSRLFVLGALLAVTAALVLVALAQLGREQELVRLRADFTSSVSHELRTPLAQILLFGETLALGRVRDAAEGREAAEAIVREARRLMGMVENVLHVARAERRANGVRPAPVALGPLAREVVAGFAPLAAVAGARVEVDVDPALAARAEPGAVRQMLLNLLDNAVRYGPPGQTVRVGGATSGGVTRLWVDDEGPGVPARDRARIWQPFVRLARDRAGAPGGGGGGGSAARTGSGLGLSVVRDLVTLHGGRAWVETAPPPAGGARFVIELLAVEAAAAEAPSVEAAAAEAPDVIPSDARDRRASREDAHPREGERSLARSAGSG